MPKWGLRHFFLWNSLFSVSDSGEDSKGTFPTWVNISASLCLSLLRHIYIPLASRQAITRRSKKVKYHRARPSNNLQSLIPHPVSESGRKREWESLSEWSLPWDLLSNTTAGISGISWAASWDCWPHHLCSTDISSISQGSNSTLVKTLYFLGLLVILWCLSQILGSCR